MFEKTAITATKTIYALIIGIFAVWLIWVCFANLPFWPALFLLPFAFALVAAAGAPLAAGASFVGGLAVATLVSVWGKAVNSLRSGV